VKLVQGLVGKRKHRYAACIEQSQVLMMPTDINAISAWAGVLAGLLVGVIFGTRFHDPNWLGGYASWPRRMLRLGHISFFGIAMLNLAYAVTLKHLGWPAPPPFASVALASANVLMPAACGLAAWRPSWRNVFALPVACVLCGVGGLLWSRLTAGL
jgi:hypothetical protein